MTKPAKARPTYSAIPYMLLAGSVVASLAGARLLAAQDDGRAGVPAAPTSVTVAPLALPPELTRGAQDDGFVLELRAIPTVAALSPMPRPVASSRSSR